MLEEHKLRAHIKKLSALLDREKMLLTTGQYLTLNELAPVKEKVSTQLDKLLTLHAAQIRNKKVLERDLTQVREKASTNAALLSAAQTGVKQAGARIRSIMNQRKTVGVYGLEGSKVLMPNATTSKRKMA